ncbi:2-succinyl-5-enolpyruvyl-6-hydroxy-3-cyclohexene-1-carboxylic-acid synthase [Tenacibaculum jejuense]|uniref:2-succinyl-5-enolpyruvyl-6-hydroxy-3-cyclohexene-1-carboxylate synthase n=1 Tax=Tenacibaculum jejuense TaxID=584609 RepID=A0A238UCM4_9FLAO|nr:2-succinyl-5-enolpyruvyl-6-hydroxy-3-cyclohexene-1-carboxylic-acid synthase [Tenacibaculum jejuense]SNR16967.1 2-succinyl-5-enolpyruvyl-6-hydroxy-3-cyclohexene-1-carboxylate synthase [Tenacibaculum jejuense]
MYPEKQLAQLVIKACQFYNVDKVVISPGSRNAPLTIGFSNIYEIETYSIVDERCAAFFALGMAQQTRKPVAIVCTSGSALLNYYPAVAEAFYSKIPLLVISADRPKHLIDIGDGQTIRQENVFKNHILYSANLIEDESKLKYNIEEVEKAIFTCVSESGPVHINVPFNEPIYNTIETLSNFEFNTKLKKLDQIQVELDTEVVDIWNASEKKLILIGVNYPDEKLQELLNHFVEDSSVLVFIETTSNVSHPRFINSIDQLITKLDAEEFTDLQPDLLITLGGMVISKRIKQFLRKYQPKHHWHIDKLVKMDTYFCLSKHIQEKPADFFEVLKSKVVVNKLSNYQEKWVQEKKQRQLVHQSFIEETAYSDFRVFKNILETLPDFSQVQVSNSAVIRYMQLYDVNPTLKVFCNRGTSGIDGSTSTAIGAAVVENQNTVLITGDLSFFYDSNALWNNYIPSSFRIILINNSGGGIFKIIPGPKSTNALQYFETPHDLTAEYLVKMYNLEYASALSLNDAENKLKNFYEESEKPKILEIFTPSDKNDIVLKSYFKNL